MQQSSSSCFCRGALPPPHPKVCGGLCPVIIELLLWGHCPPILRIVGGLCPVIIELLLWGHCPPYKGLWGACALSSSSWFCGGTAPHTKVCGGGVCAPSAPLVPTPLLYPVHLAELLKTCKPPLSIRQWVLWYQGGDAIFEVYYEIRVLKGYEDVDVLKSDQPFSLYYGIKVEMKSILRVLKSYEDVDVNGCLLWYYLKSTY